MLEGVNNTLSEIEDLLTEDKNASSLFEELTTAKPSFFSGKGLKKFLTNSSVEYIYWDNLEELLDRLYIIWGEIKAGNTSKNLHNELVNILQEIKEI